MTNRIGLIIDEEPFRKDLRRTETSVRIMSVQEVSDSGHIIKENTYLRVPFDEGYLAEGFSQQLMVRSGAYYQLMVAYSAENNPFTNFDYAYIQEIGSFHHPKRGEQFYLAHGMEASAEDIFNHITLKYEKVLMTGAYW